MPNSMELLRGWKPGLITYENKPYEGVFAWRWRPNWLGTIFWLALVATSFYFVSYEAPFIYMGF